MEKLSNNNAFMLEGKPPPPQAAAIAFQHLLAMAGGILTAPFLIAAGMGLSASETSYLISSALVISDLQPITNQPDRANRLGTLEPAHQLLVRGAIIFSYQTTIVDQTAEEALGLFLAQQHYAADNVPAFFFKIP